MSGAAGTAVCKAAVHTVPMKQKTTVHSGYSVECLKKNDQMIPLIESLYRGIYRTFKARVAEHKKGKVTVY